MRIRSLFKNKYFRTLVVFSVALLFAFFAGLNLENIKNSSFPSKIVFKEEGMTAKELKGASSNKDFLLINVHTPYEGEIPNTDMFIEYNYLMANKERLPEDMDTSIVVYCETGRMSKEALQTLNGMGYKNVTHLVGGMRDWEKSGYERLDLSGLTTEVLPEEGFTLPISWGELGKDLVDIGVIDLQKFEEVMSLTEEQKEILEGKSSVITINSQNSRFVVNLLWAIGLAQKSKVYEEGPMGKEYKERVGNFASTGGWNLAKSDATNYLGKYELIPLTDEQQDRVSEIAKNVFRPCCGNNTWFPDCNHGMAALSAIELMVSKDLSDDEIYRNVLRLNSFWFPESYLTTATYFARQGIRWQDVNTKEVLAAEYSSAQGAGKVFKKVGPLPYDTQGVGGSCGA